MLCAVTEGLQIPALVRDFACQSLSQPAGCQLPLHKAAKGVRDGHAVHRQYRWRKPWSFHGIRFAVLSTFSARRRLGCASDAHRTTGVAAWKAFPSWRRPTCGAAAPTAEKPRSFRSGVFVCSQLHGEPGRQSRGDRINDVLRLVLTASAEDIGSDAKTSLNKTLHSYFTPFVRFPTPSHTIDDIGWLVLPVTSALYAKNGQNTRDIYLRCVTS